MKITVSKLRDMIKEEVINSHSKTKRLKADLGFYNRSLQEMVSLVGDDFRIVEGEDGEYTFEKKDE